MERRTSAPGAAPSPGGYLEVIIESLVWFITGASRAFGLAITRAALKRGDAVIAAARKPEEVEQALGQREQLITVPLDVTNEKQAQTAVESALKHFGHIDVLATTPGVDCSARWKRRRQKRCMRSSL